MLLQLTHAGTVHFSDPVEKYVPETKLVPGRAPALRRVSETEDPVAFWEGPTPISRQASAIQTWGPSPFSWTGETISPVAFKKIANWLSRQAVSK
jgi:hypothetical protein